MDDPLSCPPAPTPPKKHPRCSSRWELLSIPFQLPDGGRSESPSAFPVSLQQLLLTPQTPLTPTLWADGENRRSREADGPGSQRGAAEIGKRSQNRGGKGAVAWRSNKASEQRQSFVETNAEHPPPSWSPPQLGA